MPRPGGCVKAVVSHTHTHTHKHTHIRPLSSLFVTVSLSREISARQGARRTSEVRLLRQKRLFRVVACICTYLSSWMWWRKKQNKKTKTKLAQCELSEMSVLAYPTIHWTVTVSCLFDLEVVSHFWCGTMNDSPSPPHTPMMTVDAVNLVLGESPQQSRPVCRRWGGGGGGGGGAHREDSPWKVSITTQSVLIASPFDDRRVGEDNVWRSTLSTEQKPDKDWVRETFQSWPTTKALGKT